MCVAWLLRLLQFCHRALHLVQPRRQFLLELVSSAFQNLLCGSLQSWLNLLRAIRDYLVRLAAHLLLLRGEQFVELLSRVPQRVLGRFLKLRSGFFGAMAFLLQSRAQRFDG